MFQCIIQPKNGNFYNSAEMKNVFPDIRLQLSDQLKCLDGRLEIQQSIVNEIQDIFRRRAEIESNYSKDLDKLAKYITNRHKEYKQKRDGWSIFSSTHIWDTLVLQTKRNSRDHACLADIYGNHIVQRASEINEDLQRIYKKCREIGCEIHEEVLKVLHELHTAMKTHHTYQSEFRQAENKLQVVEKQRAKLQNSIPEEKRSKSRKYKIIEKEYTKRKQKYDDAKVTASKAQNEYLLCMDSANSSVQKYFVDDLSDLIDCMDFGFHQSLTRAVNMHSSGLDQRRRSIQHDIDGLNKSLKTLDSRLDKQRFFESKNATFMVPKKFEFQPVPSNKEKVESLMHKNVLEDLRARKARIKDRLTVVKAESEEIWKSMETAEKSLSEMVDAKDWDTTRFFVEEDRNNCREPETVILKLKADRHETENFYMGKFREYVLNSNRVARLQAKYDHICLTLGDQTTIPTEGVLTLTRRPNSARRRRIGKTPRQGQPKLFGGSLEEFLEESNEDIPLIIRSCVRIINLYGLHHHGIFRVSGSQVEINNFRDAFERGEDPLADMTDASDINSVCGVLKLYLRELREPIFPIQYFDQFVELAQMESKHDFVVKVRELVKTWPRTIFIVIRYLFAFLNHLSEYSDENMMDPYNLAICFGPTLVPIPEERDQVQFQNLVNELIKNFIVFHDDIFSTDVQGMRYEKYITSTQPDVDMAESPNCFTNLESGETGEEDSVFTEDPEKDDFPDLSMDLFGKSETLEAQALYEFKARSAREVNFHKGDIVVLYKQVSNDWWRGSVNGTEGLIPDKYITLRIKGEDDRSCLEEPSRNRSSSSTTSESHSPVAPTGNQLLPTTPRSTRSVSMTSETSSSVTNATSTTISSSTTVVTLSNDNEDATLPDDQILTSNNGTSSEISHVIHVRGTGVGVNSTEEASLSSQDSLVSSGSNQELQNQLNTTLKEVEAITDQLVRKKKAEEEQASKISVTTRGEADLPLDIDKPSSNPSVEIAPSVVVLRQSSWASRDHLTGPLAPEDNSEAGLTFTANRRLWEKRSTSSTTSSDNSSEDATRKKRQTPDLVLDLPPGSVAISGASGGSATSTPTTSTPTSVPIPKPRTLTKKKSGGSLSLRDNERITDDDSVKSATTETTTNIKRL